SAPMGPAVWRTRYFPGLKAGDHGAARRLPSPSCHICQSLTIPVAFRRWQAFDRIQQHLIKVDGTFA
ncbi:MAG: hypothetical protein Q7J60_00080, partial [Bradyrhizobium sp.]|nr:hypothetical protein [Bradyrhizobium sp.]